jgi:predicted O-methyltransferase YrrM
MFWKKPSVKTLLPPPVQAEHGEYSMILSARDKPAILTPQLLNLSLKAIEYAARADVGEIGLRNKQAKEYGNVWPGEHYRLLMGLMLALKPSVVIEIGTSTGLSALCLKKGLPPEGKLVTFDIAPWHQYPNTLLRKEDFEDQRFTQHVADLSSELVLQTYVPLLQEAELIFIDATHDGLLEEKLLRNLETIEFRKKVFVLFDDIRVWTMLKMWREISHPKIDLTSFGHWSGTGLVEFL